MATTGVSKGPVFFFLQCNHGNNRNYREKKMKELILLQCLELVELLISSVLTHRSMRHKDEKVSSLN